ncbi:MAG: 7-cyano-7-deazaguanine synthase QueC [Gammaproteobacteria bacterium]|nr:7-cyano-7-deazaguanine synthase QueC [Gammaproteobacteria bacterium]
MRSEQQQNGFESVGKAVILVSGGLDSATVLAMARSRGYDCYALSFDYGQRHRCELRAAAVVAKAYGAAEHRVVNLDMSWIGGSALTDTTIPVPEDQADSSDIPITYVPARNTVFLSYALAWAEVIGARDIFIGANAVDYSGYPDCRPAFIESFERLANLATKAGIEGRSFRIHAPLIDLSKAEIIRKGSILGVDYSLTSSCYQPDEDCRACGHCDSCRLRKAGFSDAGMEDPTRYR